MKWSGGASTSCSSVEDGHRGGRRGGHRRGRPGQDPGDPARRGGARRTAAGRQRRRGVPRDPLAGRGHQVPDAHLVRRRRGPLRRDHGRRLRLRPQGHPRQRTAVRRTGRGGRQVAARPGGHRPGAGAAARRQHRQGRRPAREPHRPGAQDPRPDRRGPDQPGHRRTAAPRREDDQELRLQPAVQAGHGAALAGARRTWRGCRRSSASRTADAGHAGRARSSTRPARGTYVPVDWGGSPSAGTPRRARGWTHARRRSPSWTNGARFEQHGRTALRRGWSTSCARCPSSPQPAYSCGRADPAAHRRLGPATTRPASAASTPYAPPDLPRTPVDAPRGPWTVQVRRPTASVPATTAGATPSGSRRRCTACGGSASTTSGYCAEQLRTR